MVGKRVYCGEGGGQCVTVGEQVHCGKPWEHCVSKGGDVYCGRINDKSTYNTRPDWNCMLVAGRQYCVRQDGYCTIVGGSKYCTRGQGWWDRVPTMGAESGPMEQEYHQLEILTHTLHYLFQLVQASALFYLSLKAVDLSCVSVICCLCLVFGAFQLLHFAEINVSLITIPTLVFPSVYVCPCIVLCLKLIQMHGGGDCSNEASSCSNQSSCSNLKLTSSERAFGKRDRSVSSGDDNSGDKLPPNKKGRRSTSYPDLECSPCSIWAQTGADPNLLAEHSTTSMHHPSNNDTAYVISKFVSCDGYNVVLKAHSCVCSSCFRDYSHNHDSANAVPRWKKS